MGSIGVVLMPAHRNAILDEVEFAFDRAGDLSFMLEHGGDSARDRDEARELISRLRIGVQLLDQLGWDRKADRDSYLLEVDENVDRFAARIESSARAGLEYNRLRLFSGDERVRATTRRLLDADLAKLRAARVLRSGFKVARGLEPKMSQPVDPA